VTPGARLDIYYGVRWLMLAVPLALVPAAARAIEPNDPSLATPSERRGGVVLGLSAGAGLAGSSGYPNGASKIGDPAFYSSSDLMTGSGNSLFIMGALTDYLNFGLFFGQARFASARWHSTGVAGGFRLEVFPLLSLVPKLGDLALFTQLGIGSTTLHTKLAGDYPDADGAQSFLSAGVFYEWSLFKALGGHVSGGPSIEYDVTTTPSIERHGALLGLRAAFYGGL
jgi:hypothetical protein